MLRLSEVREKLVELKKKRSEGLSLHAYDTEKQRILEKGFVDEESGPRHRYPTRRRLLPREESPPRAKKEKKKVAIVFEMDDFIDDRNSSDYSVELDTDDVESFSSPSEKEDFFRLENDKKGEEREEHYFPKEIVIDCSEMKKTGNVVKFPENFFKRVIQ